MVLLSKIRTAIRVFSTFGIVQLFRVCIRKFGLGKPANRLFKIPVGVIFYKKVDFSNEFLSQTLGIEEVAIENLRREFFRYQSGLSLTLLEPRKSFFATEYDLGSGMSEILYLAVRTKRPIKVIETGVAAGVSTNLILSVLQENGVGNCVSIDITDEVGEVIENLLKRRWELQVLPEFSREKAFREILVANSDATLFLHDSDHSNSWQIKEFCGVTELLTKVELILFDDISEALIAFIQENYPDFRILVIDEGGKYSGVIYKTGFADQEIEKISKHD
jgi:hypothetical protein